MSQLKACKCTFVMLVVLTIIWLVIWYFAISSANRSWTDDTFPTLAKRNFQLRASEHNNSMDINSTSSVFQLQNRSKIELGICKDEETSLGSSETSKKQNWTFLVYVTDDIWKKVHSQYYTILQSKLKAITFEYNFINHNPKNTTQLQDEVSRFPDAHLIFLLSQHHYINLANMMTPDRICQLYNQANGTVLGLRQDLKSPAEKSQKFKNPETRILQLKRKYSKSRVRKSASDEVANLELGKEKGLIPANGTIPEPLVFRPSLSFQSNSTIKPFILQQGDYKRCNSSEQFAETERLLPPNYMKLSMPSTFVKHRAAPPALSLIPHGACSNDSLTVMVKSARKNIRNRELVRSMRDTLSASMKLSVKLYFLVGTGPHVLTDEFERFNDLVVGDFVDTYQNLPLKTLTGHQFYNSDYFTSCTDNRWTVFHDDDTYVNYQRVESNIKRAWYRDKSVVCLYGNGYRERPLPQRRKKYAVTIDQYPYGHRLPNFCNGPCTLMSKYGSAKLLKVATETNLDFPLEDVLFTGIYRTMANITKLTPMSNACEHLMSVRKLSVKATRLRKLKTNVLHDVRSIWAILFVMAMIVFFAMGILMVTKLTG